MKTLSIATMASILLATQTAHATDTDASAGAAQPAGPGAANSGAKPAAKPAPGPADTLPGGRPAAPGTFQTMRWSENWSQKPKADAGPLDKIKHITLGRDDIYLSLGGGLRVYYTDWDHTTLGLKANDKDRPVQTRARLNADLHVTPYLRAFVELGDNREYGENLVTAPNNDRFDVQQAFVDITVPLGNAGHVTLRPGRYEMPVGNGKLLGVREGLNMRYSYQGLRATYVLPGKITIDAFSVRPVNIKPGSFDDGPNHAADLQGIYVSSPGLIAGLGTDVYFYEVNRAAGTTREAAGIDHRQNWGARLWKKTRAFDLDIEGDLQRGHIAGQPIEAYAILADVGYTLVDRPLKPRLGLRANVFSGDGNLGDGKAGTFVPASPRLPLISESAFFGLSNLMDLYPNVTVKPNKDITIMAGPDFLWRQSSADGVYIGPAGASFKPYAGTRSIGTDLNLEVTWQATRNVHFRLFETYFAAGDAFKADGGHNGNYFGLLGELRF